jgi:lipoprotein NlpI
LAFATTLGARAAQDPDASAVEARRLALAGDLEGAIEAWNRVLEHSEDWRAYLQRAELRFRSADIEGSVADFDRVVELAPAQEPYLWQRGIAQYYAGELEACARQFEVHRTVNPDDVENAVWHILCVAGADSWGAARAAVLPVGPDPRPPMTTIYDLFRGRARLADLLAAGGVDPPQLEARADRLFYTHLYAGLYLDAIGQSEPAAQHLREATTQDFPHYMRDVARVHLQLRH